MNLVKCRRFCMFSLWITIFNSINDSCRNLEKASYLDTELAVHLIYLLGEAIPVGICYTLET